MEFHLNDIVYVIDSVTEATTPCAICGISQFVHRYVIIEAEISDIMTHLSATDDPIYKYRVRTNDEIRDMTWHEAGKTLFANVREAEARMSELE